MGAVRSVGSIRVDWLTVILHGSVRPELRDTLLELTAHAKLAQKDIYPPSEVTLDGLRDIAPNGIVGVRAKHVRRQGGLVHHCVLFGEGWSVYIAEFDAFESGFGNATIEVTGTAHDVRGLVVTLCEWLGDFHKTVSRLDLCTDFTCTKVFRAFVDANYHGAYVCRGRDAGTFASGGQQTGAFWASKSCRCTVYDKRVEQELGPDADSWYRLEFQMRGAMFKRASERSAAPADDDGLFSEAFAITDPEASFEAVQGGCIDQAAITGLFRYLTGSWLRILTRVPDRAGKNQSKVPVMPEWSSLSTFPVAPGVPVTSVRKRPVAGTLLRAAAGLLVYAASINAVPEVETPACRYVLMRGEGASMSALLALLQTGKLKGIDYAYAGSNFEPVIGGNDRRADRQAR